MIALIAGNIRAHQAISTVKNFVRKMKIRGPFSESQRYGNMRTVSVPSGANYLVQIPLETRGKLHPENAIMVAYQVKSYFFSAHWRSKLFLISKLIVFWQKRA